MTLDDWERFDLIVCMDNQNLRTLKESAPSVEAFEKVFLATKYCDKFRLADAVPDPYYGGAESFEYVIDLLEDACRGLLENSEMRILK